MHYFGTFLNDKGQEIRRAFQAQNENELRLRLEKEGLKIKELKIDGTLEVADAHSILEISAKFITAIAVLLSVAVLFSYPFPFVRKIWFDEHWGYYGLMNIACFAAIAWGMRKMSVIAVFAGMAILLYEQFLTSQGFYFLWTKGAAHSSDLYFTALATALTLVLLAVYLKAFHALHLYYDVKWVLKHTHSGGRETPAAMQALLRFGLFLLYLAIPFAVSLVPSTLSPYEIKAAMRLLGETTCLISAIGIGFEIQRFFKTRQALLVSMAVILFHLIALGILASKLHAKVPFELLYNIPA